MRSLLVPLLLFAFLGLQPAPNALADEEAETLALRRRLQETTVTLDVKDLPFAEILKLLQVQTGLNVHIDPRVESDIAEVRVAGLYVEDLALESALDLLRQAVGESVVWHPIGNVVVFTIRDYMRLGLSARVYPVAGHTVERMHFVPTTGGLVGPEPGGDAPRSIWLHGCVDELIGRIRGAVQPAFWEETEGAEMRALGEDRLVVTATRAVHAEIAQFLGRLERMEPDAVRVEVHAVEAARLPTHVDVSEGLSREQAAALLGGPAAGPALCLAVRAGMQSTAYAGSHRAYVAAYEVRFAGGTSLQDPRVETEALGMAVRVRTLGTIEHGRILLKLGVALAEPKARGGTDARTREIVLPAQEAVRRDSTLLLVPGTWHVAEGRTGGAGPGRWGFLVRATPVHHARDRAASSHAFTIPTSTPPATDAALADRRVKSLRWQSANLDQIVTYLRTITGFNFFITPRVREEVYEEVGITLDLVEVSLPTLLDLVTEPYELTWRLQDDLITIALPDEREREMVLRYFDVQDLGERVVTAREAVGAVGTTVGRSTARLLTQEALVDLIQETVGSEATWEDPAAIEAHNDILVARNTPEVLDAIDRLLTGLRASRSLVVTTVEQVELSDEMARLLRGGVEDAGFPVLLEPSDRIALEAEIDAGRATRSSRERLISVDGSGAPRAAGEEIAYVADYDVRTSDSAGAGAPVRRVEVLHSGSRIGLRTVPVFPDDRIYVEITFERSRLSSMESSSTPHGSIELPVQDVWRVGTGLRIPDGRTAIVCASHEDDRWMLLLVTPRKVALD